VVLIFPILTVLVPEPVGARWGALHKSFYLPPDVKARSERNGRYLWIIKYILLLLIVLFLANRFRLLSQTLGPRSNKFLLAVIWGLLGGVTLFLFRAAYRTVVPNMRSIESQYPLLQGPLGFWLTSFFLGGLSEELWRGLCIAATRETQRDTTSAIIWISISFAIGRLGGLPGRIHGEIVDVLCEAITGAFLGYLFIMSGSVVATFIASFLYYTCLFFQVRRSVDPSIQAMA